MLEPGFEYWFDGEACVAYVDTGRAWVAAGAPIAAEVDLGRVANAFVAAARAAGRGACFFATERRFAAAPGFRHLLIGEQPVWEPGRWGETLRATPSLREQLRRARAKGVDVSHIHVRHIWPMPKNLGDLLKGFDNVLVPEMNTGQFKTVLRDQFLVDARPLTKTSGQPFTIAEIEKAIGTFFDTIPGNEGGEVNADATQLPSIKAVNP